MAGVRHADDLRLALALADLADGRSMARYRAPDLQVETKPDLTPVSEVDRAIEQELRERLAAERPGDAVIGEEYGSSGAEGARRWVIDPIDGTKSFVRGMDTWSTLIALQQEGTTVVGVVSMPALGRRWWATRGGGAFTNGGRRIRVSPVRELADAHLMWSGIEDWDAVGRGDDLLRLARRCWRSRGVGDAWQYMLVAEGAADIATDPAVSLWDLAAVAIVVEEAGGRFSDLAGRPGPGGGSALATNGALHDVALGLLASGVLS